MNDETEWENLAIEAFNMTFSSSGDRKNTDEDTLQNSINLFYESISAGANKYWPYIKLADLVSDEKEKTKLYIQALRVESNEYSIKYLFNKILIDYPTILDEYLI